MNDLLLLAVGAPAQAGMPNLGPWLHFIWVLIVIALVIFVLWWAWGLIGPKIPQPLNTILFVLGVFAIAVIIIVYVLMPLSAVF
jgi:hypothetical protein